MLNFENGEEIQKLQSYPEFKLDRAGIHCRRTLLQYGNMLLQLGNWNLGRPALNGVQNGIMDENVLLFSLRSHYFSNFELLPYLNHVRPLTSQRRHTAVDVYSIFVSQSLKDDVNHNECTGSTNSSTKVIIHPSLISKFRLSTCNVKRLDQRQEG